MALVVLGCSIITWSAHAELVTMKLLITGLNHRTAPVEVRERLAFEEKALPGGAGSTEATPGPAGRHDPFHLQSRGSGGDGG